MLEAEMRDPSFAEQSTNKFERPNFRHGRRNDPKFGTHVRIDTLTSHLKQIKKN